MDPKLSRILAAFDAHAFATKHGGFKESPSIHTFEYLLPCPRCGSDRLRWNNKKGVFICWGCKLTGDSLFLIQIMEKCDELGALDYLYDGYVGGDAKIDKLDDLLKPTTLGVVTKAPSLAPILWPKGVDALAPGYSPHAKAWAYLSARGVTEAQVQEWRLGVGRTGRLTDYVVFPCYIDDQLVYYQGRACWDPPPNLSGDQRKAWIKDTGFRKTLNPSTHEGQATAGDVLLNYDEARRQNHIVIVEGPFDAIKIGRCAVALLGKVLTPQKLDRLMRAQAQTYTIYLDNGEEERAAAEQMAAQLSSFGEVLIARPPQGVDAGDLSPAQNAEVIKQAERWRAAGLQSALKSP